jgi:flavin reductase (DIM6/NTAB) family NADH-FMN oxidoreductase RutF
MSRFQPVALEHANRLLNHGPTVLVTSVDGARRNVMPVAWLMPVAFVPPRLAIMIDKRTFTRELVKASGGFGVCLPGMAALDLTYALGNASGRDLDKFAQHAIASAPGPVLGMPVIETGCAAWLECRLIPETHTEDAYDTCYGEIVSAAADPRVFRHDRWHFDATNVALHTIHYLGGGHFVRVSATLAAVPPR